LQLSFRFRECKDRGFTISPKKFFLFFSKKIYSLPAGFPSFIFAAT